MACGCNSSCGCNIVAGVGILVSHVGDKFTISSTVTPVISETFADSAVIAEATNVAVFDGLPASILELPTALAGRRLEAWNIDTTDDVALAAKAGDAIHGAGSSVLLPSLFTGTLVCVSNGVWLINLH